MPETADRTYITRTDLDRAILPIWAFFLLIGGYLVGNHPSETFPWIFALCPFAVISFIFARAAWRQARSPIAKR